MRKLYQFYWDVGRMGDVEGLFVADETVVQRAIGQEIYFGEILGKHSEVHGTLDAGDLTVKSDDQDFIDKLVEIIGSTEISGYNPLQYLPEEEEED